MNKENKAKRVPYSYAKKYVDCILGITSLPAITNDTLRRQYHDAIARQLSVDTSLIKRAAWIVEHLGFSENPFRSYEPDELARMFKKHLDDIYFASENGEVKSSALIANWTFDALHPENIEYYEK